MLNEIYSYKPDCRLLIKILSHNWT